MQIAFISDIHEDFTNLEKAFKMISEYNIKKIICLGDVVGFEKSHYSYNKTRSAKKCVQLLHDKAELVVAGNHDLLAVKKQPCFYNEIGFPENWYNISMDEKVHKYEKYFFIYRHEAENDLEQEDLDIISKYSFWKKQQIGNLNISFSHFIYPDINGHLASFANNKNGFFRHFEWMNEHKLDLSFVGHAHIQGVGIVNKKGLKIKTFGKYELQNEPQIILCPNISEGRHKSGFVLFDTVDKILEIKRL